MKDVTFIRSIHVLHAENSSHTLFFSGRLCTPRMVIRHMTSNCDVCNVDMDMQMSCQNAAPWVLALFSLLLERESQAAGDAIECNVSPNLKGMSTAALMWPWR